MKLKISKKDLVFELIDTKEANIVFINGSNLRKAKLKTAISDILTELVEKANISVRAIRPSSKNLGDRVRN